MFSASVAMSMIEKKFGELWGKQKREISTNVYLLVCRRQVAANLGMVPAAPALAPPPLPQYLMKCLEWIQCITNLFFVIARWRPV